MPLRLGALDGLRGIAIALVVWYHLWQVSWLDPQIHIGPLTASLLFVPIAGALGVELFFFLSAFCLCYPYVRAHFSAEEPPGWTHFAYRRFIKIVPSYLLSLMLVIVAAALPGAKESFGANIEWSNAQSALTDLAAHLAFVHTFWNETYSSINGVLWTLGIEVQFYLIFPALIGLFLRVPLLCAALLTVVAVAYRLRIGACCQDPIFAHSLGQLPGYLDLFAAGMLSAFLFGWLETQRPRLFAARGLWTLVAFAGAIATLYLFHDLTSHRWESDYESWWLIRNGAVFAAVIMALALGSLLAVPAWKHALANPALVFLASISYNLYLYHQIVFRWIATWPFVPHSSPVWPWFVTLAGLAVAIGVATIITYAFERPLLCAKVSRKPARISGTWPTQTVALQ